MILKKFPGLPLRPSQRAAELLPPNQRWCVLCHQPVLKNAWESHKQSRTHRLAYKKLNKLKHLSLSLWERHRGASVDTESNREKDFEAEFAEYRRSQQLREEEHFREMWDWRR